MKSTMMRVPLSTNALLDRARTYFADSEVVGRLPDKSPHRRSYADIARRARQLARALREDAGLRPGEAVGTLCWNHAWHLECYFGIPAAGGVLHTLNLRLSPDDLAYVIADADDRVLIVDDVLLPVWERVRPLLRDPPRVIVVPFAGTAPGAGGEDYEAFVGRDASDYAYPEQDENDAMAMCYTSGTTGRPKGVVYSHRSMVLHAITGCIPDLFGLSALDRILMITPMFHANAWAVPFSAMMVGANQIMPGPHLGADDLLDLMETTRPTIALGVPTIWLGVLLALERDDRKRALVPGMRALIGGSAASLDMIERLQRFDIKPLHGWGMTETSPLGSCSMLKAKHAELDAAGRRALIARQGVGVPFVETRIVDEMGHALPWDDVATGEVQVRGPWVSGGYHATPNDPGKFTDDGWLRTGDLGAIDADGYMRLVDRSKDLIKSGGEWISSVDLENLVMSHPGVAEAAVIGIAHPKWVERPLVVAARKPGVSLEAVELRAFLAPRLARFQVPDDYEWIDAIPKSGTGKFQKTKLREIYADRVSVTPD